MHAHGVFAIINHMDRLSETESGDGESDKGFDEHPVVECRCRDSEQVMVTKEER